MFHPDGINRKMKLSVLALLSCSLGGLNAFAPVAPPQNLLSGSASRSVEIFSTPSDDWQGEIVPDVGGAIRGCSVQAVGEEPTTEWIMTIDGVEADLGRFGEAIYKKIISDAKQQRFQGFRPGTIPPHLQPTYRTFTMDECARETVLEAMEQNNIRPFSDARSELKIESVSIPPVAPKKKKKSKKRKKKGAEAPEEEPESEPEDPPQWRTFEDMKGAIDAGWKPGQSFSFVATNVRGQKVLSSKDTEGARPLGLNY